MAIQQPMQPQPPRAACALSLISGTVSFTLGILGNLLAAWFQQRIVGSDFTGPWLILIGLLTLTGLLFGAWLETHHRLLLSFAGACLLFSLVMLPQAVDSTHLNHPPVIVDLAASPVGLTIGQHSMLNVVASDDDGDALAYYWHAEKGILPTGAQADTVEYTAVSSGLDTVKVTVTDGRNAVIQELRLSVRASDPPPAMPTPTPSTTTPVTSTLLPTPTGTAACPYQAATDAATIIAIIKAEGVAANTEDLQSIQTIFRHDALIQDGASGETWTDPITRYATLFKNTDFRGVMHYAIQAVGPGISGDTAYFASGSRGSYRTDGNWQPFENPSPSDHWILSKNAAGCWQISEFTFNASHLPFP
jgi:hypothetical protein